MWPEGHGEVALLLGLKLLGLGEPALQLLLLPTHHLPAGGKSNGWRHLGRAREVGDLLDS